MSPKSLSFLAGGGSAALLLAAFGFQLAGYAPCELCILQRWPHAAALVITGLIWLTGRVRFLALAGGIAALVTMGTGIYHGGIELSWWQGPAACSGGVGNIASMSTQELMQKLQAAPVVRCDEIAWSFLGISMAMWNAVFSALLAGMWFAAARRSRNIIRAL